MAQIDTSIYGMNRPTVAQGLSGLATAIRNNRDDAQRQELMRMQMQNARAKQSQRLAEENRRKSLVGLLQANPNITNEQFLSYYDQLNPEAKYSRLSRSSTVDPRVLALRERAQEAREVGLGIKKQAETRRASDLEKKYNRLGLKDAEDIRQFEESQSLKKEKLAFDKEEDQRERVQMMALKKIEREEMQDFLKNQLPDHLKVKADPKRMFTQASISDINATTEEFSDIYKKTNDLGGMIDKESFMSAKVSPAKRAELNSQISQILVDYNRAVAGLGALAGQDLAILEKTIPSPAEISLMTYGTWQKVINNLKANISRKYSDKLNNRGLMVTGKELMHDYQVGDTQSQGEVTPASKTIDYIRGR